MSKKRKITYDDDDRDVDDKGASKLHHLYAVRIMSVTEDVSGPRCAEEYGVQRALEQLIHAEKRDIKCPRVTGGSRVRTLTTKWDKKGFGLEYRKYEFETRHDLQQCHDALMWAPFEPDIVETGDDTDEYIQVIHAYTNIPELSGEYSDTNCDSDSDSDNDDNDGAAAAGESDARIVAF
jgi:hypothetical protein